MIQFKYQGKIYDTSDLDKKLKKLKITIDDIEIIVKEVSQESDNSIKLYTFKKSTGESIVTIYPTLEKLVYVKDPSEYTLID